MQNSENTCREMEYLISMKQDNEISPENFKRLEEHLSDCENCRKAEKDFNTIKGSFAEKQPEGDVPADLLENTLRKVDLKRHEKITPFYLPGVRLIRTVNALAAGLVVALGLAVLFMQQDLIQKNRKIDKLASRIGSLEKNKTGKNTGQTKKPEKTDDTSLLALQNLSNRLNERVELFKAYYTNSDGIVKTLLENENDTKLVEVSNPAPKPNPKDILLMDLKVLKPSSEKIAVLFSPQLTSRADEDTSLNITSSRRPDMILELNVKGSKSARPPANIEIELKVMKSVPTSTGGSRTLTQTVHDAFLLKSGRKVISQTITFSHGNQSETFEVQIVANRLRLDKKKQQKGLSDV